MIGYPNKNSEIKHKLRELKQTEIKIRFEGEKAHKPLVWDQFFDLHDQKRTARFSLPELAALNRTEFKAVIDEYYSYVYFELYRELGISRIQGVYNPSLLAKLGLAVDANEQDIRKRFRELANLYHPDKGGDAKMFIELMDHYKKLLNP